MHDVRIFGLPGELWKHESNLALALLEIFRFGVGREVERLGEFTFHSIYSGVRVEFIVGESYTRVGEITTALLIF